ncbi:hypothetical protein BJX99DRAFT_262135 [Aspergillus californicus]
MSPSSGYTVADIHNHETINFTAMWQDTIEPQTQPLPFNLSDEMLLWDHTPLTNNGVVGSMMPGPAHGTNPPVIDLTSTPEPNDIYFGRFHTDSASYSPSEPSHPPRQGETPSTIMEDNRPPKPQQNTASGDYDKAFGRKDHLSEHRKKRHESVRTFAKAEGLYSSGY